MCDHETVKKLREENPMLNHGCYTDTDLVNNTARTEEQKKMLKELLVKWGISLLPYQEYMLLTLIKSGDDLKGGGFCYSPKPVFKLDHADMFTNEYLGTYGQKVIGEQACGYKPTVVYIDENIIKEVKL